MKQKPIIIAGGGICGLACALAAAQVGLDVTVLEKASHFDPIGAGLQLGPNAVRALQSLGAWDAVSAICRSPSALMLHDARSGKLVRRLDLTDGFESRFGAPYRVAHRADLHQALLLCVQQQPRINIQLGQDVCGFENSRDGVSVVTNAGNYNGTALIAADGIKSPLRSMFFPNSAIGDSGLTIHRAPLQNDDLADADVHLWMGPGLHAVHYAVGAKAQRNLICVTKNGVTPDQIAIHLAPKIRGTLEGVREWTQWPGLFVEPMRQWSKGRCLLLGDAAHGTLPFMAQGAAMALEDAVWLKNALQKCADIPQAFAAHATRLHRTAKLHHASLRQGKLYHHSGVTADARNLVLTHIPNGIFHQHLHWLYGHK